MSTLLVGILGAIALAFAGLQTGSFAIYLNPHAVVAVFGGTFIVLLLSSPTSALKRLFSNIIELFQKDLHIAADRSVLLQLTQDKFAPIKTTNPLVAYASTLWARGISQDMFIALLSEFRTQYENRDLESILTLKALGKYPSALGMIGTVTGIVTLFSSLTVEGKGSIGPALAVAMTSTFYGLLVAHVIVMPLADRLIVRLARKKQYVNSSYEILLLIERNEPTIFVEKELVLREAA